MDEKVIFQDAGPCACYHDGSRCACEPNERALRNYASGTDSPQPMTAEQREWCLDEIDGVEGYSRSDYEKHDDSGLASGVLEAWRDYCRDKGFAV